MDHVVYRGRGQRKENTGIASLREGRTLNRGAM